MPIINPPKAPESPSRALPWEVVFVASSTPEKLRDFQAIAKAKRLPILFADFKEVAGIFTSIDETGGKFKDNAKMKTDSLDSQINKLSEDADVQGNDSVLAVWAEKNGVKYRPEHMHMLTEDSGYDIPKHIWDAVDKDGVPQKILDRIKGGGPGVETGPVSSSMMGADNLQRRTFDAIKRTHTDLSNPNAVEMHQYSNGTLTNIYAGSKEKRYIKGKALNYFFMPDLLPDGSQMPLNNYIMLRTRDNVSKSGAELGMDYVTKYSARADLVDNLVKELGIKTLPSQHINPVRRWKTHFDVGVLSADDKVSGILQNIARQSVGLKEAQKQATDIRSTRYERLPYRIEPESEDTAAKAEHALSYIEKLLTQSNAIVLPPVHDDGTDDQLKFQKMYDLMSLVVAKQLNTRDGNKPIILMNEKKNGKGAWDDAIALHYDLVNQGLTKEYAILSPTDVNGSASYVTAHSNSYFHVITGDTIDKIQKTTNNILEAERAGFVARETPPHRPEHTGTHPDDDPRFKVAIFCSASSENTTLNDSVKKLSHDLAENDYGLLYGGGDRYTMGAVLDGVRQYRAELQAAGKSPEEANAATYIAGISTQPIVTLESSKGALSDDLSYAELTKDIYERMAKLLTHSGALVVAPGGAGTVQEWMAAMLLRKQMPEQFGDKQIIIYNPQLLKDNEKKVWDTALKVLLGADYSTLAPEAKREREQKLGIVVETTLDAVHQRIDDAKIQWMASQQANRGAAAARV